MNSDAPQDHHYKAKSVTAGVILLTVLATRLWGDPDALTCTTDTAFVEIVQQDSDIIIFLQQVGMSKAQSQKIPSQEADIIPWNGFGRYEWSYLDFTFANQTFSLSSSFDTAYPNSKWETFLSIGDDIHACVEKYNRDPFDDFIALKFDAGQCWNLEHQAWSFNCY